RMRPSQSLTDKLPSHATIYPCSYNQRPATQISRACCNSLFACPANSESGVKGRLLPGTVSCRFSRLLSALRSGDYEMASSSPWVCRGLTEIITKRPAKLVPASTFSSGAETHQQLSLLSFSEVQAGKLRRHQA